MAVLGNCCQRVPVRSRTDTELGQRNMEFGRFGCDDPATMTRTIHTLALVTSLGLAALAPAQTKPQLTLATVLERGPALAMRLPTVMWFPSGHSGTVALPSKQGGQAMHRLQGDAVSKSPWFTAANVAAALPTALSKRLRGFPQMSWLDEDTLRILHDQSVWQWDVGAKEAVRTLSWRMFDADGKDQPATLLEIAPGDGHAVVRFQHNLFLHDRAGERHQLTFDGSEDVVMGDAAHRAEIGITKGTFWSSDGRHLAFYREDQRPIARYPYQDVKAMPPTLRHGRYPMAGETHSVVRVFVCDTTTYETVQLESDPDADVYWTNVSFGPNGTVTTALVNRGQDHMELCSFDAGSGKKLRTILREHDTEWIEPEHAMIPLDSGQFLWWSRRSGYRHIYRYDANSDLVQAVTSGNFDVLSLLKIAEDQKTLWFQASGDDPRQLHLFSASLLKEDVQQLTKERGSHQVSLSADGMRAHVFWSNLETRPSARILDTTKGTFTPLPQPKDPLSEFALPRQEFFEVDAADGSKLYGHVAIPSDLKPGERAPVIHYVYGGPHAQLVKDQWFGGAGSWLQGLAGDGFIVCRLDNRGTPNRGIEFEQQIHRNLGTLEVQDQLRAVDWLRQQPYVDPARIGVHGWSFGGYMTLRLMLLHPTTYACGISGAPVTDWAMYETGYTERYMDTPQENPEGFAASSVLPLAKQLQRPLLVVHGTDDRTVMWSHTLKFVDACVLAGKPLDYFPYPQQLHGLRGPYRAHFLKKLRAYFTEHLHPKDRATTK